MQIMSWEELMKPSRSEYLFDLIHIKNTFLKNFTLTSPLTTSK